MERAWRIAFFSWERIGGMEDLLDGEGRERERRWVLDGMGG